MDLFPRDYKKSETVPASDGGGKMGNFLTRAKGIFSFSGGGFSGMEKLKDVFSRVGVALSSVILAFVLLSWGSLLIYKEVLKNQIADLKEQQSKVFSSKDQEIATSIVDLEEGSILTQSLLKSHIYSSEIFNEISKNTLPRVQWISLDFSLKELNLTTRGFAADYASLAKQIIALEDAGFSNLKVSNIALDKSGGVSFNLVFNFDYKLLQK